MTAKPDPTQAMIELTRSLDGSAEGASCTQTSFKRGKTAFFYVGTQGGRYKAMFKLDASASDAAQRAKDDPDRFQVGTTAWVTARFTASKPLPSRLWQKWLKERYTLAG